MCACVCVVLVAVRSVAGGRSSVVLAHFLCAPSDEGRSVTSLGGAGVSGGVELYLADPGPTRLVFRRAHDRSVFCCGWNSACDKLAVGASGSLFVLDVASLQMPLAGKLRTDVMALQFCGSSVSLAGVRNGSILTWDVRARNQLPSTSAMCHSRSISDLRVLTDCNYVLASAADSTIALWDRRMERRVVQYAEHQASDRGPKLALSDDQRFFVCGGIDQTVRLWDLRVAVPLLSAPVDSVPWSAAYSPGRRGWLLGADSGLWEWSANHEDERQS